jgi:hypothetical protein
MKLQVNTSGAWRNVVDFDKSRLDEVRRAVNVMAAAINYSAKWCVVDDKGNRQWLKATS